MPWTIYKLTSWQSYKLKFNVSIGSGGVDQWLTHQTSNLRIADQVGSNLSGASRCFFEQETLHLLLSTGWFQERIREGFNKLIVSNTIKLKLLGFKPTAVIHVHNDSNSEHYQSDKKKKWTNGM
jgi:hypothetical protein